LITVNARVLVLVLGSAGESRHKEVGEEEVKEMMFTKHPVLPREEFDPGKPIPCAAWGDPRGEA
jgi:hypothetical protein